MEPLVKMMIALVSMVTMFLANILILGARNRFKGIWRGMATTFAFALLILSFIFIVIVVFSV
ncbi:DUF2768 family protein [Caldalkalibacillus salinus]|uniref:DUF2768 family protein n=1 Tax=Caldalkalibacillus salinus TaxID=2803787 RepID=UPI0019221CF0|nr:DUF2768 family protein [Caldalkalibacillus salinus]